MFSKQLHLPPSLSTNKSLVLVSPKWLLLQKFLPIKKWLGVSTSKSFTLSLFAVNSLLLTIFSTLVNTVIIWKSVRILSLITWSSDNLKTRTSLSHAPAMCGEFGGLKFHLIFCWSVKFVILSRFNSGCPKFSSRVAPLKLDPESDNIVLGLPLLLMNLSSAFINESVSSNSTSSKWTTRVNIQANRQPHLFNLERRCLMNMGPKKSKPVLVNGRLWYSIRNLGRLLIYRVIAFNFSLQQVKHCLATFLIDVLAFTTQYIHLSSARMYSVPLCVLSWKDLISGLTK